MTFANTQATVYNDKVVRQFAIMTVVWGVIGMLVGVIVAAQIGVDVANERAHVARGRRVLWGEGGMCDGHGKR